MGYALVIKNANYGVNRVAQVTLDPSAKEVNNTLTNVDFSYGQLDESNNTIKLQSISLTPLTTTAKYTFALAQNQAGVSINPISGKITLSPDFNLQNIVVNAVNSSNNIIGTTTIVLEESEYVAPITYTYSDLTIKKFQYSTTVAASGGKSGTPTLSYSYKKIGSDGSSQTLSLNATVTYDFVGTHTGATIVKTSGIVTFGANTSTTPRDYTVRVTVTCPDGTTKVTSDVTVSQKGKEEEVVVVNLTSITAAYSGGSKPIGTSLSANDFVVTGHYDNNTTNTLTGGISLSTERIDSVGNNTITVYYDQFSDEVTIVGLDYIVDVDYDQDPSYSGNGIYIATPIITTASENIYNSLSEYNSDENVITYSINNFTEVVPTGKTATGVGTLNSTTGEITLNVNTYLTNFTDDSYSHIVYTSNFTPSNNSVSVVNTTYDKPSYVIFYNLTLSDTFTMYSKNFGGSTSNLKELYARTNPPSYGCISTQCSLNDIIYVNVNASSGDNESYIWLYETSLPIVDSAGFKTDNLTASSTSGRYLLKGQNDIGTRVYQEIYLYKVKNNNFYISAATTTTSPIIGKL